MSRAEAELRARVARWIADDPDPAMRAELAALLAAPDLAATDLPDRFAGALAFGTAGLRGLLGAGPNRMNRAVVLRTTWGLAQHLLASVPRAAARGVVVGGDARRMSRELSEDTAAVLAAAGLRVHLFRDPVPTPLVAFAVKHLSAAAGVVVTASHNPPEYNGYKVYWDSAAQIVPPVDAAIAAAIDRAPAAREVPRPDLDGLRAQGRVSDAPGAIARAYLDAVRGLAVHPSQGDRTIGIVYTPMHGVGDALARQALAEAGFTNVTSVPEQRAPDGTFPTVRFPNPEEKGAMDLALALARRTSAQLVIANDPDADRLAIAVPSGDGYRQLTGNEVGALLGHYILTESSGPGRRAVLATIVSSPLLGRIAASLGVAYDETLTGFKWIADRAMRLERDAGARVVFAYEEALGYCVGDAVRDKDGISAAVLAAEMTAVLRARGLSPLEALDAIFRRWGVFVSTQANVTRPGAHGAAELAARMDRLRASPPTEVAGDAVAAVSDYLAGERRDTATGERRALTLPASNVVALHLASGGRIVARPSGTEPKAKIYVDVCEPVAADEPVAAASARATAAARSLAGAFEALFG